MKLLRGKLLSSGIIFALGLTLLTGCGGNSNSTGSSTTSRKVTEIRVDGSSTVFPVTEAIAEEFRNVSPNTRIPVGVSGTGGGFKKFLSNEIDISNASRSIKEEEAKTAEENGVEYVELPVAYDGLSILVNNDNTWVDSLTVDDLNKIWAPNSTVETWKDIRDEWPDEQIKFYAPGTDSGTFDYFTDEINGESGAIRTDFVASEDDNILVQGIAGDKNSLGFFGFAYYEENKDKLKIVKIDNGHGPIEPTFETIKSGEYSPLSRPLYIYVRKESLTRPEVKEFITFYLDVASELVPEVGYVALPDEEYKNGLKMID